MPKRGGVVETLLRIGSDPQQIWRGGTRPLHLAAERGDIHILAAILLSLIEHTVNYQLNVEQDDGMDPLDLSITGDHNECIAMLC